jgi:hypothetical protein
MEELYSSQKNSCSIKYQKNGWLNFNSEKLIHVKSSFKTFWLAMQKHLPRREGHLLLMT